MKELEGSGLKGFTLIGRSTKKQMERYLDHWECENCDLTPLFDDLEPNEPIDVKGSLVNFKIKRITEIHKVLDKIPSVPTEVVLRALSLEESLEPEPVRQWAMNRNFIAYWTTVSSLEAVIEKWIEYKEAKIIDIRLNGSSWSVDHELPEQNGDYG